MISIEVATTHKQKQQCYALRHTVFVEEQGVPLDMEIDEHDETDAVHFLGTVENVPVAAARIVLTKSVAKIGRLAVLKDHRGKGFGAAMMEALIDHVRAQKITNNIALDAQTYALAFYENLGFTRSGDEFLDAGIPHLHMVKNL